MSDVTEPRITVRPNASLKVEGGIPLFDNEGRQIPTPEDRPYALCRCGASKRKPFCDASHKDCDWDGTIDV